MNLTFYPLIHVDLTLTIILFSFLIFIKAKKLYFDSFKINYAYIALGFLFSGIFELIHIFYSYLYDFMTKFRTEQNLAFLYITISGLFLSFSFLISIFYNKYISVNDAENYYRKILKIYSVIALLSLLSIELISNMQGSQLHWFIENLIFKNPSLEVFDNGIFLVCALAYYDIQLMSDKKRVSLFVAGLLLLAFGQAYLYSEDYSVSFYRMIVHFIRLFAYICIFFGISNLDLKSNIFSLRLKISIYPALLLLSLYLTINTIFVLTYHAIVLESFKYIFTGFYLFSIVISYYLSHILTHNLSTLIKKIDLLKPWVKPEKIYISSNDEISILANKINEYAINDWEHLNKINNLAHREILLRNIIEMTRNTLEIDKIVKTACEESAKIFDVQRTVIAEYDYSFSEPSVEVIYEYIKPDNELQGISEHMSLQTIKSYWAKVLIQMNAPVQFDNIEKSDIPDYIKDFYRELGVKSIIGIPIKKGDEIWGTFVLSDYVSNKVWTKEDVLFLESISNQLFIAIKQAQLFKQTQMQLEKESTIRKILSVVKSSQDINEIYRYLLENLIDSLKADYGVWIATSEYENKPLILKIILDNNKQEIDNFQNIVYSELPKSLMNLFIDKNESNSTVITNSSSVKDSVIHRQLTNYFKDRGILSYCLAPILKQNKDVSFYGVMAFCCKSSRIWSDFELNVFDEIMKSASTIVWEIKKRNELDELKNTFILTLAHDLQAPLYGERKALESIMSMPQGQLLDDYKNIIADTINDNINLSNFLNNLVRSYYYELGRKKLYKSPYSIAKILSDVVLTFREQVTYKSITVQNKIDKDYILNIDKSEISRMFSIIFENAINYTLQGGNITITVDLLENSYVNICIKDNGAGMSEELINKLFKRYEMAVAAERKIGSGLSIYLAKQIAEAHNGYITVDSKKGEGTTFCVFLILE